MIDEEKKLSEYQLNPADTLEILVDQMSIIALDQPLTLDEVRDSHRYPLLMHRLLENSHPESQFDYLVIALHALMIESGFQMVKSSIFRNKNFISSFRFRMRKMPMI